MLTFPAKCVYKYSPNPNLKKPLTMPQQMPFAVLSNKPDLVRDICGRIGNPDQFLDDEGWTALALACREGFAECAKALLEAGSDPNMVCAGNCLPLHIACAGGHAGCAEALLAAGADPNARDDLGWTALHHCAADDHADLAELLIRSGANPDCPEITEAWTPLHIAARSGHAGCADALARSGASLEARAKDGQTPLLAACGFARRSVCLLLAKMGADLLARDKNGLLPEDLCEARNASDLAQALRALRSSMEAGEVAKASLPGADGPERRL